MDLFYYYVGECVTWIGFFFLAMLAGFKLSEYVHDQGGWVPAIKDFLGLNYREDQK